MLGIGDGGAAQACPHAGRGESPHREGDLCPAREDCAPQQPDGTRRGRDSRKELEAFFFYKKNTIWDFRGT